MQVTDHIKSLHLYCTHHIGTKEAVAADKLNLSLRTGHIAWVQLKSTTE